MLKLFNFIFSFNCALGVQIDAIEGFELVGLVWCDQISLHKKLTLCKLQSLSKVIEYTFIIKPNDLSRIIFILISPGGMHKEE